LTVITRDHLERAREQLQGWSPELLVIQPHNRETAPGILLPLLYIQARDPDATVGIFPSDHFILEEAVFMEHVLQAVEFLATHRRLLILLGIAPDRPEGAYGWIEPRNEIAREAGYGLFGVRQFWEKPNAPIAERLYVQGWLWNSLVMVGRLRTFLRYFRKGVPELWANFQAIRAALGTAREAEALEEAYQRIPAVNLSAHLLERIPQRLGVLPAKGVRWSDWGDEGRIFQTLQEIGKAEELTARLKGGGDDPWKEAA
jgi:mannose-1-phosphate guanylyltransferase